MEARELQKIIALRDRYMTAWAQENPRPQGEERLEFGEKKEDIANELKEYFLTYYYNIPLFYEYADGAGYCLLLLSRVPPEKINEIIFHRPLCK